MCVRVCVCVCVCVCIGAVSPCDWPSTSMEVRGLPLLDTKSEVLSVLGLMQKLEGAEVMHQMGD